MRKFWNFSENESEQENILRIDGYIAEESWFQDDVTPKQLRAELAAIIGTSQVFSRVAKPIREQTYILYEPLTILGCLTVVRKYKPEITAEGLTDGKKLIGMFFFVHNKKLRESFDTYHKIEKMAIQGFKSEEKRIK